MEIFVKFDFAASRRLTKLPKDHPCSRLHGHTFEVQITLAGEVDPSTGFMVDFSLVEEKLADVKAVIDHQYLNDISGLENPTTEILARWLWQYLSRDLLALTAISVQEHYSRGVIYRGD
jgi:6-pyruvoyltetrahydropterin/6-carboxytetrahydropterin synthase